MAISDDMFHIKLSKISLTQCQINSNLQLRFANSHHMPVVILDQIQLQEQNPEYQIRAFTACKLI